MSCEIRRIDNNIYSVNFENESHKAAIINIVDQDFDSKINNNHELYFSLAKKVANDLYSVRDNNSSFKPSFCLASREWTVKVKENATPLVNKILGEVVHQPADDQVLRLEISLVNDSHPLNDLTLNQFALAQARELNRADCQQYPTMIPCTDSELSENVRGKFHYPYSSSHSISLDEPLWFSPFTILSRLAFQRYENEFTGHDFFNPSDCNYCLILKNNELKLVQQTDQLRRNNVEDHKHTVLEYKARLEREFGKNKLECASLLAKIDFNKMLTEGLPLTPEHVYRLNILLNTVETKDLSNLLAKIKKIDLIKIKSSTMQDAINLFQNSEDPLFTHQEVRGIFRVVENLTGSLSNATLGQWLSEFVSEQSLDSLPPEKVNQMAKVFFPTDQEEDMIFTGRNIFYPINSCYTTAGNQEYKPWIDHQELLHTFQIIKSTGNWDLYHEKLALVVCKKHLFRPHPSKQYVTGALIPAPLGPEGQSRWYKVSQVVYNGYGMLTYTLKSVGNDPSLPLIKLYRSTSSDPYAVFGETTVRTDLNPLNLPGYEGLGKTDLYQIKEIQDHTIPLWAGYLLAAIKAVDEKKTMDEVCSLLSKVNIELFSEELRKVNVRSFQEILRKHDGVLNSLYLSEKIPYITYEYLRAEYASKSSVREDNAIYQEKIKQDTKQLISFLKQTKPDLASFSKPYQIKLTREIDNLIEELTTHFLTSEVAINKEMHIKNLHEGILGDLIACENLVYDYLEVKNEKLANVIINNWIYFLSQHAKEHKVIPERSGDIHFVGHSLGGALAQTYMMHDLIKNHRVPCPGSQCATVAFDSPGVSWRDNEVFKKFMIDHADMLKINGSGFRVFHQHEAGDPVPMVGVHLGSAKSVEESKVVHASLNFQAQVLTRNPKAVHPALAYSKTVHGTQFLEGTNGIDYFKRSVNAYEMGLMESYETHSGLTREVDTVKAKFLREKIWKFPVPFSMPTMEAIRSSPMNFWLGSQFFQHWVEEESEMIPFLDQMGNFAADENGLCYPTK